jgi:uncharacterized membrane-anchored protein
VEARLVARCVLGCAVLLSVLASSLPASSQQENNREQTMREMQALAWQRGPTEGRIGDIATLKVQQGQAFLDGPNTRRFLELNQNPPRDNHYTLLAQNFFAVFFFEDSGYVRDDEKLDGSALLKSLQEADKPSNEERKRLGMPALYTAGWHVPPHYDPSTKRLEWGVRLRRADGQAVVNYTIRLLGRHGVMRATLVSDPESLDRDIAHFKASLTGYSFVPGARYSEFRAGDRVAEYGLAALVLGGAAAVATKTSFGKAIGKFLIFGIIALGSAVAAFFRKLFRRS